MKNLVQQWAILILAIGIPDWTRAAQPVVEFRISDKHLEILVGKKHFANYSLQDEQVQRPFFSGLRTPNGVQVTRNHPPIAGADATDHATMHPGLWLAFGDLSGADFWRNMGTVRHLRFLHPPQGMEGSGSFTVINRYESKGSTICDEICRITTYVRPAGYLITWHSQFHSDQPILFGDQEEMGLGVRVATAMSVPKGGQILNSSRFKNEQEVWGKQANWCSYSGHVSGKKAGILLMPHPLNHRPSWFHARDYGLLVANPFGQNAFTRKSKSVLKIDKNEKFDLRFGILIHDDEIDRDAAYRDYVDIVRAWPERLQEPYEDTPVTDNGLSPLLFDNEAKRITTIETWENQKQLIASAWRKRLGEPPPKPEELDARTETHEVETDHRRQLVSFASEGEDRIRAYLLTPSSLQANERRPAVVVFHPTTNETLREPVGLGSRPHMALALQLVRRGYITLSPECFIMKNGGPRSQAHALARFHPNWTGLGKMTFDASRCIDFLETLPQVDHSRIGCIGHSLGAKEVLYAMAFEPRFKVGVFNEGGIGLRMSNWTDPWYLTESMKPHMSALDHHQVLALVAPRPFLIMGGDSADGAASWNFVKAAREVYALLQASDRIGLHNHQSGHAFPETARELAYHWLDHWLEFADLGRH